MKSIYKIFYGLLCYLFLVACSDDHHVRIDSLSVVGDEFYCNQKVKLWMCVESSDLWETDYFWECDGGELTQPQGLDEMTWKAPNVPGRYIVRCTVNVNGKKDVREREMLVSAYYFDKFENSSLKSFSNNSACDPSYAKEANGNGYWRVYVKNATSTNSTVYRDFGDEELCFGVDNPFSLRIRTGFIENMPQWRRVRINTSYNDNTMEWRLRGVSRLPIAGQHFISEIRVTWYPMVLSLYDNPDLPYSTSDPTTWSNRPGTNNPVPNSDPYPSNDNVLEKDGNPENRYNVSIRIAYTNGLTGQTSSRTEHRLLNTLNNFKNGEYRTLSLGIDENLGIYFYNNGDLAFQSDVMKNYQEEIGFSKIIYPDRWTMYVLNGDESKMSPVYYFDDAYASNTEILK